MNPVLANLPAASILIRPVRRQDEWTETYLGRMARAMGLRRPWRHDLETLRAMVPSAGTHADDGRPMYGRDRLPRWASLGRAAQIRVCAQCLLEHRYIRARWRICFLTVCTDHGLVLKDGLVEPAITAHYKRPDKCTVSDVTSEALNDGATCPTPTGLRYAHTMWQPFEEAVRSEAPEERVADKLAWALLGERLLDAVLRAVRGPDHPPMDVPRHEHRGWWLGKSERHLAPDRDGVFSFVLGLTEAAHRRAALHCLTRLIADEVRKRTVMSRLPLVELKERLLAAQPTGAMTSTGALPRAMHPPRCKSLEAVEAILGCSLSLLHLLVREKRFEGVVQIQFGRKRYVFVPDAEVERVRAIFASCMTFVELLETLAIDRRAYLALHGAGFVPAVQMGCWRRYRRQDVAALLSRLDSVSRPVPSAATHFQPLMGEWLHMRRRPRLLIRQIFEEVLDGRLPVFKQLDGEGLQAYWVDPTAPVRLRWLSEAHLASKARERTTSGQRSLWELA